MLITTEGIIIRISCEEISVLGRITSGVKLMNLAEGVKVASFEKVREKKEDKLKTEEAGTENSDDELLEEDFAEDITYENAEEEEDES